MSVTLKTDSDITPLLNTPYDSVISETDIVLTRSAKTDGCGWDGGSDLILPPAVGELSSNYVLLGFGLYLNPDWGLGSIVEAYYCDILDIKNKEKWIVYRNEGRKVVPKMNATASSYTFPGQNFDCCGEDIILAGLTDGIPLGYAVNGITIRVWDKVMQIKLRYVDVFSQTTKHIEVTRGCGANNGSAWGTPCTKFGTGSCRVDTYDVYPQNRNKRHLVTGVHFKYTSGGNSTWEGIKTIESVRFRDYTTIVSAVSKPGLFMPTSCMSQYGINTFGAKLGQSTLFNYIKGPNGQLGGTCYNSMKTFCSDPNNITSDSCRKFLTDYIDDMAPTIKSFCEKSGDLALVGKNADICGCFMPASYYDNYLKNDLYKTFPSLQGMFSGAGPECYFKQCQFGIKRPAKEQTACPSMQVCLQNIQTTVGGDISAQSVSTVNSCIFDKTGVASPTNTTAPATTPVAKAPAPSTPASPSSTSTPTTSTTNKDTTDASSSTTFDITNMSSSSLLMILLVILLIVISMVVVYVRQSTKTISNMVNMPRQMM